MPRDVISGAHFQQGCSWPTKRQHPQHQEQGQFKFAKIHEKIHEKIRETWNAQEITEERSMVTPTAAG